MNDAPAAAAPAALSAPTLSIRDITADARRLEAYDGHERVWLGSDEERGLEAIIAIHNTALGPGLGGTRVWPYPTFEAALTDALRLSRGMTLKSAIAGVPFGGAKGVIIADPKTEKTPQLLDAYAELLQAMNGAFFTGEDVGLSLADADHLRARTRYVTGTTAGGSGNPSPVTAFGVFLGIEAAAEFVFGKASLNGLTVAVQGVGSVGFSLCERLHGAGARLVVADIAADRVAEVRARFAATSVPAGGILAAEADVLAPCALGAVISADTIPTLKTKIVAGSANNVLARHRNAAELHARGILYAPDYVINSGGLMNVAAELAPGGYDREATMARVRTIPIVLTEIFERSRRQNRPTNDIAQAIAMERIAAARK